MKSQCTLSAFNTGCLFYVCEALLFTFLVNCKLVHKYFEASLLNGNLYKVSTDIFFFVALRPNAGHGLLILEVSRSHTTTHLSR
jgi:hypothetical protein